MSHLIFTSLRVHIAVSFRNGEVLTWVQASASRTKTIQFHAIPMRWLRWGKSTLCSSPATLAGAPSWFFCGAFPTKWGPVERFLQINKLRVRRSCHTDQWPSPFAMATRAFCLGWVYSKEIKKTHFNKLLWVRNICGSRRTPCSKSLEKASPTMATEMITPQDFPPLVSVEVNVITFFKPRLPPARFCSTHPNASAGRRWVQASGGVVFGVFVRSKTPTRYGLAPGITVQESCGLKWLHVLLGKYTLPCVGLTARVSIGTNTCLFLEFFHGSVFSLRFSLWSMTPVQDGMIRTAIR